MRNLLRALAVNGLALYFTSLLLPGLYVTPRFESILIAAVIYTVIATLLTPALAFLTGPFNLLTLGYFSAIITLITLLIMTHIHIGIAVSAFTFPGFSIFNFSVHPFYASNLLSYLLISVIMFSIIRVTNWLFEV